MVTAVLFFGLILIPVAIVLIVAAKNPERAKEWRAKVVALFTRKDDPK